MGVRLFIALVLTGAAFHTAPVMACPILLKASPRVGSVVEEPVERVTLRFSAPINVGESTLKVFDEKGRDVTTGSPQGQESGAKTLSVPVKITTSGRYKVVWRIHCECTPDQKSIFPGDYSFTVR